MTVAHATDQQFVLQAIETAVRSKISEVMEREIKAAQQRVEDLVRQEVDRIALNLLRNYDVANRRDELVITVKKFEP